MKNKLSIIVPVYNVEQFLRKCVDSLLAQDISDYEIILVDDGSTDNSGAICDDYASPVTGNPSPVTPIRVIHQPNGGLSAARNSGIKVAQGEYLMFVDSDDYIEPNVLGGLLAQIEREELDVLRYNFQNVRVVDAKHLDSANSDAAHLEYEVFEPFKAAKRDVDLSETAVGGETFLNERLGPGGYAWQFVIKRSLLYNDGMRREQGLLNEPHALNDVCLFKEGIYFEDTEWTPRMLVKAKRVASTEIVVYNYFWREGSISLPDNPKKREKVLRDKIALIKGFREQSKMVSDSSWYTWMTSFTAMTILNMLAAMPSVERKKYLRELKLLYIFPLSIKREKVLSHRIKTIIANISPAIYCDIMHILRR